VVKFVLAFSDFRSLNQGVVKLLLTFALRISFTIWSIEIVEPSPHLFDPLIIYEKLVRPLKSSKTNPGWEFDVCDIYVYIYIIIIIIYVLFITTRTSLKNKLQCHILSLFRIVARVIWSTQYDPQLWLCLINHLKFIMGVNFEKYFTI